jgi:hypothetical protein
MFHVVQALDLELASATRLSSRTKPPARDGLDPTLINLYQLWEGDVELELRGKLELTEETHPEVGTYMVADSEGVHVHFHNSTENENEPFFVRIMMRTWEPQGAAERNGSSGHSFRNYEIYLDVLEVGRPTQNRLHLLNATQRREARIPANLIDISQRVFSHLSADQKREQTVVVVSNPSTTTPTS